MNIRTKLFIVFSTCTVLLIGGWAIKNINQKFNLSHISEPLPFHPEWEIDPIPQNLLNEVIDQPFSFIGEGGQSWVFASQDQKYVIKFFKFNRFRPSWYVNWLPNDWFYSYRQKHLRLKQEKLNAVFQGHKLAYDKLKKESGLIFIQLNPSHVTQNITLIDQNGQTHQIDLGLIPYVIQLKGETLEENFKKLLMAKELHLIKENTEKLVALLKSEYSQGLIDLDRGIMHNMGMLGGMAIHLDVGKVVFDESVKNVEKQEIELDKVHEKITKWLKNHLHRYSNESIEEGHNVFASNFYRSYQQQLTRFLSSRLKSGANALPSEPKAQREWHESFVKGLRKEINQPSKNPQGTLDLVKWIYLGPHLKKAHQDYLESITEPLTGDLFTYLLTTQKKLKKDHNFTGLQHHSHLEDHFLRGNLPSVLFTIHQTCSTTVLRMAHPLGNFPKIAWPWTSPEIHPEFIAFVQSQPRHLYINLMKRKGVEAAATHTIESLEQKISSLSVVTLDKNSNFYWQDKNHYPEKMQSSLFKQLLQEKLLSQNGHFYWSKDLEPKRLEQNLLAISETVHTLYFGQKEDLNRQERQDYIELFYLAVLNELVQGLSPSSMNITCRQGMDRAPSLFTLWMYQKGVGTEAEIAALLLTAPILIDNRPSHKSRIERFVSAAKRIKSPL